MHAIVNKARKNVKLVMFYKIVANIGEIIVGHMCHAIWTANSTNCRRKHFCVDKKFSSKRVRCKHRHVTKAAKQFS